MLTAAIFYALWLAALYVASSQALKRGHRKELWRSIMAGLCGLAVTVRRSNRTQD